MADRLISLRIEGFRSIKDLTIPIEGLQVLIGENGAGKSTIIEAFELLRKAASDQGFMNDVAMRHGSIRDLIRAGSPSIAAAMRLTVMAELDGTRAKYTLTIAPGGIANPQGGVIESESMTFGQTVVLRRDFGRGEFTTFESHALPGVMMPKVVPITPPAGATLLYALGLGAPSSVFSLATLLRKIRVHVSFETRPNWASQDDRNPTGMRSLVQLAPAVRLERGGVNLASAYQRMLGDPKVWREALLDLQIGLGQDLASAAVDLKAPGGFGELVLHFSSLGRVPSSQLSDGQLAFLAIVALVHLHEEDSVVLIDEPEAHLHPAMLGTIAGLLNRLSSQHPVLVATHSDALLDAIPEDSVRVVQLDAQRASQIVKLDHDRLEKWREQFQTLGEIRREGVLSEVVEASQ